MSVDNKRINENGDVTLYCNISDNKGYFKGISISKNNKQETIIPFELYNSFRFETYNYFLFKDISISEKENLLKKVGYKMIHLIHYDAFVVIPAYKKIITIYVPEMEISHVIGRYGNNIERICNIYGIKKIKVKAKQEVER